MNDELKPALGEELRKIRQQLDEAIDIALPARIAEARAEGVEAERERCLRIFRRYLQADRDACGAGASNPPIVSAYVAEFLASEPEPPAPEPMTVEKVLALIRGDHLSWRHGTGCEKDLLKLVREQARKDAEIAVAGGWSCSPHVAADIRKAAGLE